MTLIVFLLLFSFALAYNPYMDYFLCRYYQDYTPTKAETYCLRAIERAPSPTLYVDTIRLELKLKKLDKALSLANAFKNSYPDLPEPYLTLHSVYSIRRESDKAIAVLEEGYIKNPNSRELIALLAEDYLRRNNTERARSLIEKLAKMSPDNPLPYFMLAKIALLEGKQEEAIMHLERSLNIRPLFEAGFITLGGIYEQRGEYSKAEGLYKDILKQDPNNRVAMERLAYLYTLVGRYEEARELYRRLYQTYQEVNYLYQYSILLLRGGHTKEAREVLERLYLNSPENIDIAYTYALTLEADGDIERALSIYENLHKRLGDNPRVVERLAGIYIQKKEYKKAEEVLKRALLAEPKSYQLNLLMANLMHDLGRDEEAVQYADKAISINPKDYRGYFIKAIALDSLGKMVSAEENLRRAIQLKPDDPELYNHLGYSLLLWYEDKRIDEAEGLIKRALEKDPENPAYIDSMAWVLYYRRNYVGAYELLKKALEKEREDPVIHEHMGDVLSKLGREEEAQRHYRKAYELLLSGKRGEPNQKERLSKKLKR